MKCKKRKRKVVERAADVEAKDAEVEERAAEVVLRLQQAVDVQHMKAKMKNLNLFVAKANLIKLH